MEQSNIAVQGMQSDGVSGFTRMGNAAAVSNSTDAFSQVIAQMLGGFAQTEDSSDGTTALQQTTQTTEMPQQMVQQQVSQQPLLEEMDFGQMNAVLQQIQQLCPEDLQILQGIGEEMNQEVPDLESLVEELTAVLDDGQTSEETTAVLTNLEELFASLQEAVTEKDTDAEDDTEPSELAVHAAAALLETLAQALPQDAEPMQEEENTNLYGQAGGMTVAAQTMETVAPDTEVVQTQLTDIAQPRQSQQVRTPVVTDNTTDTEATVTTKATPTTTATAATHTEGQQGTSSGSSNAQTQQQAEDTPKQLFDLQNSFRSTVSKVKGHLQQQETTDDTIDVDALQTQLMSSQELRMQFAASAGDTKSAEVQPVAQQVQEGITTNLDQGNTEFTIRLNPENLGEITVKVQEVDGKTTVHLFTASDETAHVINSELHALREAVKPMAVEVHEAISQSAQGQNTDTQGFDLGSQFAEQQRRQQQWSAQPQDSQAEYDEAIAQEEATQQLTDNGALDTYV